MEIKNISQKILGRNPNKIENRENCASHTNPFGVNFKGNMIAADVFEPAQKVGENLVQKASKKGKMWASAIVGSMNSVNEVISRRLNSVIDFGNRIKTNVQNAWDWANSVEIDLLPGITNTVEKLRHSISGTMEYDLRNLKKLGVESLDEKLQNIIAVRLLEA